MCAGLRFMAGRVNPCLAAGRLVHHSKPLEINVLSMFYSDENDGFPIDASSQTDGDPRMNRESVANNFY